MGFFSAAGDSDIPGVPIPPSPFQSSLTDTTTVGAEDLDDVYAVEVGRNQLLEVTMTLDDPEADDDFDLLLYPPGTKAPILTAYQNRRMIAGSRNPTPGGPEAIRFVPLDGQTGTHLLHVYCLYADGDNDAGGRGAYTINWSATTVPAPSVATTVAKSVIAYGATTRIEGTVTVEGASTGGLIYEVLARPFGSAGAFKRVASGRLGEAGRFSAGVTPLRSTQYYVRTKWGTNAEGVDIGYGYGPRLTIMPRAAIAFTSTPRVVYRNRAFTVSGTLKPAHPKRRSHVRIIAKRWNGTRYVTAHTSFVRNGPTGFRGTVTLPRQGTWRLYARVETDSLHAAKTSPGRKVIVR